MSRPIPAGIVDMRVEQLLRNGVKPDFARELAEDQIRNEIRARLKDDDNKTVPRSEKGEKQRRKYYGADPVISGCFDDQKRTTHARGNDPTGKSKPKPRRSVLPRFGDYEG